MSVDFRGGFWSRDGRSFVNVGHMLRGRTPADVAVYEFDDAGQLRRYVHAERAQLGRGRTWQLQDVVVRELLPRPARAQQLAALDWPSFLDATQLGVLVVRRRRCRRSISISTFGIFGSAASRRRRKSCACGSRLRNRW